MRLPTINTSATNFELTRERQSLISQKLAPLGRLLVHEEELQIDVNIRCLKTHLGGDAFYVSTKVTTDRGVYMAVATGRYLTRALTETREYLRRSISRGESVKSFTLSPVSRRAREFSLPLGRK